MAAGFKRLYDAGVIVVFCITLVLLNSLIAERYQQWLNQAASIVVIGKLFSLVSIRSV